MDSTMLGPRSSTPKRPHTRLLPSVLDISKSVSRQTRLGRRLPPIPTIKPSDNSSSSSNVPKYVQPDHRPKIIKNPKTLQKSPLPYISSHSRQLPKLPDEIGKRQNPLRKQVTYSNKAEERKERLHEVYKEEADDMYKQGHLDRAIELYNAAIKVVRNNKTTYIARSRCYKDMGKIRKAFQDLETALAIDPLNHEALFQKGELLFHERDFESAMIYYNKGMQQRPEMKSFHDRITKTQDAMLKSGSRLTNKLIKSGKLSMVLPDKMKNFSPKISPKVDKTQNTPATPVTHRKTNPFIYSSKNKSHNIYRKPDPIEKDSDEKRIREALGQMYNDKEYLERLVQQAEKLSRGSADLCTIAENGLNFLYDRVLFWVRQENGIPLDTKITLSESREKQLSQRETCVPRANQGLQICGNRIPLAGIRQPDLFVPKSEDQDVEMTERERVQSIRTGNTEFYDVLSGQKLEFNISQEKRGQISKQTFLTENKQIKDEFVINKEFGLVKEFENSSSTNDSDSGINVSFTSCRETSDPDQFDPVAIRTIQEEYLTPLQSADKKILKQRKNTERRLRLRSDSMMEYMKTAMDVIETAFINGRYKDCIARARPVLTALSRYNEECEEPLSNISVEAKLHSYIGNAAIEIRDYPTALHHHQRDLEIGEDCNDEVIVSRALGNLGRIFVFKNKHQEALELFSRKIPLCKTNVETAWLYHEIGNCFLVLTQYAFAREAARRSIEAADAEGGCSYQLQSCVLKGVAEVKLREYHSAFNTFERAMKQAREQEDATAEESIREALVDVNERILEEIRVKDQTDEKIRVREQTDERLRVSDHTDERLRVRDRSDERQKSRNSYGGSRQMESLPEIRELSGLDIYEDDGLVSLTDTRCNTYDLQSELGPFPYDLETAMTGPIPHLRTVSSRMSRTPDTRRLSTCHPQSSRRSLLPSCRSNTVY